MRTQNTREYVDVVIATGESLSTGIDLQGYMPVAIEMQPATTWTVASITFLGGETSTGGQSVYTSTGGEVTVAATSSITFAFSGDVQDYLSAQRWLWVRSGTAAAAVTQSSGRTLKLILRPY